MLFWIGGAKLICNPTVTVSGSSNTQSASSSRVIHPQHETPGYSLNVVLLHHHSTLASSSTYWASTVRLFDMGSSQSKPAENAVNEKLVERLAALQVKGRTREQELEQEYIYIEGASRELRHSRA